MDDGHLLNLNPNKTLRCLGGVLEPAELDKIRAAVAVNVSQMLRLAASHLRYAAASNGASSWRQRVSRSYYACYTASRAIRLGVAGYYSTESTDHKNIGDLPDDFPSKAVWMDILVKFRADRNIADYDHTETERSLELSSRDYLKRASDFMAEAKHYLRAKGIR